MTAIVIVLLLSWIRYSLFHGLSVPPNIVAGPRRSKLLKAEPTDVAVRVRKTAMQLQAKQAAQLSQRDRAAGGLVIAKSGRL